MENGTPSTRSAAQADKLLRALLDSTSDFIMIADAEGKPILFNRAYAAAIEAALGVAMRPGMRPHKLLEDPAAVATWDSFHERVLGGESFVVEISQLFPDGLRHFSFSFSPIVEDDVVTGFCEISRDITERIQAEENLRESERLLRESQEVAQIGSYVLDLRSGEWSATPYLNAIFGIDESMPHTVEYWNQLLHPEWRDVMLRYFSEHVIAGGNPFDKEYMIVRESDGVERWVHGLGKLEFDDGGRPLRMIGTIRDITERKLLEQRIRHKEKMEAIGQLAGGVAHDFNNQLVGIMGYADLLRGQTTDRDVSRFVDKIILAARRAADLTAELLAFSRKGKYLSESVDLERIVVEVVNILRHTVDKRITIQKTFRASPATTLGDPSQLQNAILNLGLNARDAMPEGGVLHFETEIIELGAGPESSHSFQVLPGPYVRVTVRDTGVGMSRELQERVFEPFFTTKEKGRGTGMGLAAVYGTVKNHRGAIDVVSEPGRGTTIAIDLPLHFEREPPNATHDTPPRSERALRQALVVDDEEEVRHVLKAMLEGQGFAVLVSSNGAEGVELYRRRHEEIDIVILDMVMPVMGGRETYLEMKAINPNIHALLVSGYSLDGEAQSILDDGVRGFLQKPFRLEDLCAKLDELADPGPG